MKLSCLFLSREAFRDEIQIGIEEKVASSGNNTIEATAQSTIFFSGGGIIFVVWRPVTISGDPGPTWRLLTLGNSPLSI